jgi:hypothetical protein
MHGQKHLHISQNLPSNYPVIFSKKCELRDKIYKMQLALLFQFQIHTEKEKQKKKQKTMKLNGLLGLVQKNKINSNNSHGGFKCVYIYIYIYAELYHITQTLGHPLDTGKIR